MQDVSFGLLLSFSIYRSQRNNAKTLQVRTAVFLNLTFSRVSRNASFQCLIAINKKTLSVMGTGSWRIQFTISFPRVQVSGQSYLFITSTYSKHPRLRSTNAKPEVKNVFRRPGRTIWWKVGKPWIQTFSDPPVLHTQTEFPVQER